jgi:hypothetical protein
MKKIKMAMMALAAVSSIGGAFAFSPAAKPHANTYYAIRTGQSTFHWTQTTPDPELLTCARNLPAVCTITTATAPQDNQVPAAHANDQKGEYVQI